jgi:hypothetical protein
MSCALSGLGVASDGASICNNADHVVSGAASIWP